MLNSRKIQMIGATVLIIVATLITISATRPSTAATTSASAYPDYANRHPGISNPSIENSLGSDFFQRQRDLGNVLAGKDAAVRGSDYYERQVGLGNLTVATKVDLSWPSRPDFSVLINANESAAAAAELSDYSLRHPELVQSASAMNNADYFLRHRESSEPAIDNTVGSDWFERH